MATDTHDTLIDLLRASLARPAHCYHAHVPGRGYVNDGSIVATRADYDRQRARRGEAEIDNLGWAPAYAEPGYTQPRAGVLMANWNVFPSDIADVLETLGYAIEWSDEWTTCEDCARAVRTQPDAYDWTPGYQILDGALLCKTCAHKAAE